MQSEAARLAESLTRTYGLTLEACEAALRDRLERLGGDLSGVADDIVLAVAYLRGTPEAVDAFRDRFRGMIRYVTRQCLPVDEALEAEEESWAALWEQLGHYEGRSSLGTWLYVVVRRWCWRRSKKRPPPGPEWSSDDGVGVEERLPSPEPEVGAQVACQSFCAALDRCTVEALRALSPQERSLLRLRFVHQMPLETLRQRPEIYTPGEPMQPVYGITRRVQRAGRKVREAAVALLSAHGYDAADCVRLLQECEQVESAVARRLIEDLARDDLQIGADDDSHASRGATDG